MDELVGWKREERTLHGVTRAVYYKRNRGPGVILMARVPGSTPEVLRLGALVADSGFTVALPTFFGTPGKPSTWAYTTLQTLRMCISWEFNVFAANDSSPVVDWIRALCQDLHAEVGGSRGIGAIGLCITGNFALALTVGVGGIVQAPILGEPALPFPKPFINNAGAVHLSPTEEAEIRQNTTPALGLRFTAD